MSVNGKGQLQIKVTNTSATARTIKVQGIKYDVGRLAPDGDVNVKFTTATSTKVLTSVANATVVDVTSPTARTSIFTVGKTGYTVNGTAYKMDVTPYISNSRTYLPVRYAGYALGVAEENVFWDGASQTATMIKGDRVVQFTVGKKAMVINGASIGIDVGAEITDGRTMLPFRALATALGAQVDWNNETKTVMMKQ